MRLKEFQVEGLFGTFLHQFEFPIPSESSPGASTLVLHGSNGVGKTTVLRMIQGMRRLEFDAFRNIPFTSAHLAFSDGARLEVHNQSDSLLIRYGEQSVALHLKERGPATQTREGFERVDEFRAVFYRGVESITTDLIPAERFLLSSSATKLLGEQQERITDMFPPGMSPPHGLLIHKTTLSDRLASFMNAALARGTDYFSRGIPNLFQKLMDHAARDDDKSVESLVKKLHRLKSDEEKLEGLGLGAESWSPDSIAEVAMGANAPAEVGSILAALVGVLEARYAERNLVARRLQSFERLVNSMLLNKRVRVKQGGFAIETGDGKTLSEDNLSSGEYHLLYLLIAAVTARRRGTVLLIDEPEMSLHIAWQRQLIPALVECASNAEPLFVFATHSPDIAGEYPQSMRRLGPQPDEA